MASPTPSANTIRSSAPSTTRAPWNTPATSRWSKATYSAPSLLGAIIDRRIITILHEQAHMWFGDLVTMKWWDDLWLNESFAEYMSYLAAVENTRMSDVPATFASEKSATTEDQRLSTHPIAADVVDLETVLVNFDGITYGKGASVLRQLVAWVGQRSSSLACASILPSTHGVTPPWQICWRSWSSPPPRPHRVDEAVAGRVRCQRPVACY